jgi:starch synthase
MVRCVYVASEVAGFAKTGGLADVAAALPRALAERGHDCTVMMPLYRSIRLAARDHPIEPTPHTVTVTVGGRSVSGRLWRSVLPVCQVPVFLIEQVHYFERDDAQLGQGLYGFTLSDGSKRDYPDNCERFVFFCRAILEALPQLGLWPDVLHVNDWQAGLAPVYLREDYRRRRDTGWAEQYARIRTLFTIHNLAYQGVFWHWDMPLTGLPWRLFNFEQLEFYGRLNLLKGGLVFADQLSTVSPTYAREIQTPYFGCGLQNVLAHRHERLHGIVNGADYEVWNPATDKYLAATYDAATVLHGKPLCKAALQRRHGFPEEPRTPLLGLVSRLVVQKGLDLVGRGVVPLLRQGVQLVVLGVGDPAYHQMLRELQSAFPRQVGLTFAHNEELAHQIEAGSDIFLMPSEYEPCGLSQLYSLKYGTVPLVRRTGGLADTVVDATPAALEAGQATGFAFLAYTPAAFQEALERALTLYHTQPDVWLRLLRTGMAQDWSWRRSAAEYERLYLSMQEEK